MQAYRWIGNAGFLLILVLAGIFYLERILYADSAFFLYKLINFSKLNVEAYRYSTLFIQLPAFLTVKLGLPLRSVVFVFSISFILVFYIVYLLSVYKLKNIVAGLVIILLLITGVKHSFFHSVTETWQAIVYSMLFYAWIEYVPRRKISDNHLIFSIIRVVVGFLLILLAFFAHPVALFPLLYIIGYRLVSTGKWRDYDMYLLAVLVILVSLLKFILTSTGSYEGQFFASLKNTGEIAGNFFHLYSLKFYTRRMFGQYLFHTLVALILIIWYLYRREWIKMVYFLFGISAFIFITVVTYYLGDSDMGMERSFLPLGIFIFLPLAKDLLLDTSWQGIKIAAVLAVLITGTINIIQTGDIYRSRLEYIDNIFAQLDDLEERKFVIGKDDIDMQKIIVPWAIGPETLMYSSLDSPDKSATFYLVDDAEEFVFDSLNTDLYMCVDFWRDWSASSLNNKYFRLEKTSYRLIRGLEH